MTTNVNRPTLIIIDDPLSDMNDQINTALGRLDDLFIETINSHTITFYSTRLHHDALFVDLKPPPRKTPTPVYGPVVSRGKGGKVRENWR